MSQCLGWGVWLCCCCTRLFFTARPLHGQRFVPLSPHHLSCVCCLVLRLFLVCWGVSTSSSSCPTINAWSDSSRMCDGTPEEFDLQAPLATETTAPGVRPHDRTVLERLDLPHLSRHFANVDAVWHEFPMYMRCVVHGIGKQHICLCIFQVAWHTQGLLSHKRPT
jgi:hypothetical protein